MSDTTTFFWKTNNKYLPIMAGVVGLTSIPVATHFLYGKNKGVYADEIILEEEAAQELADFLEWVRLWMSNNPAPDFSIPNALNEMSAPESADSLAPEIWVTIGILGFIVLASAVYGYYKMREVNTSHSVTDDVYLQALRAFYKDKDDKDNDKNKFITHQEIIASLISARAADIILKKRDPENSSNVDTPTIVETKNALKERLDALEIKTDNNLTKTNAYTDLSIAATKLEEAYHKIQIYKHSEYVIWNIMCMPVTVAALVEFFIHIGLNDFDWESEIFLTFFHSAILGALLIVYAALAIRVLYGKWNADIDKSLKQYKISLTNYLYLYYPGNKADELIHLMTKNIPMLRSNWMISSSPKELTKIGFRKNDLYESDHVCDKLVKHEEDRNQYRAKTYLFVAAKIVCVLFISNLVHTKSAHFKNTFSLTADQQRQFAEFKLWLDEVMVEYPPESKLEAFKQWLDEWMAENSPDTQSEGFSTARAYTPDSSDSLFNIDIDGLIAAFAIFACLSICAMAVYKLKQPQATSEEDEACKPRMRLR